MTETLILWFHPEHARSKAGRAIADAAEAVPGAQVVNMGALYPDPTRIDLDREVERLFAADRLVLQFPIHWYLAPPLVAAWQNQVLTRMFYIHPDAEGERLKGLPFRLAVTAGNVPEAYRTSGVNRYPLPELLRPFEATASRCGFRWGEPFVAFRANRLDEDGLAQLRARYTDWLTDFTDAIPRPGQD